MTVICNHCQKPIEKKDDLIVMKKWGILPRPLHKACWADLFTKLGGAGTISYATGVFQPKKSRYIPINSTLYTIIAVVAFVIAVAILFLDFSGATMTSGGTKTLLNDSQQIAFKALIFALFLIPMAQRLWTYSVIESKIPN